MTGTAANLLYALDTVTGAATPVSTPTGFGVSENNPQGIASGYTRPPGYEIDSSTGAVTYTGGPATVGVHKLYAQASDHQAIDGGGTDNAADAEVEVTVNIVNRGPSFTERGYSYTLTSSSDGSTTPIVLGAPSAADPENEPITYSLRSSDPADLMYMFGTDRDALYTIDNTTGAATARVGTAAQFGVRETYPFGMTWHNGQLYMAGNVSDALFTLDITTGKATRIIRDVPDRIYGVASHNGELYATTQTYDGRYLGRLYRVDLDTLTFTQIGGDDDFRVGETFPTGIASHGNPAQLYMVGTRNAALYTLDTATGAATRVGSSHRFDVTELYPTGLASHGGSLYMIGQHINALYTLNTTTGAATRVGGSDRFGINETAPYGIATGYRMPENFTIDSATGEIAYTGASAAPGVYSLYVQASDSMSPANIADTAVDDAVRVIITIPNRAPTFAQDSYEFTIMQGVDGTVTAQPVGTVTAADPEGDPVSYNLHILSASDSPEPVYMVGDDSDALYTVDAATGAITRIGSVDGFDAGITAVRGLTWHDGELYLVGGPASEQDGIYTLDPATGTATRVTRMTDLGVGSRALTAVASHRGTLYAASSHSGVGKLYAIDLQAGTATQIGRDDFGSANESKPAGLASHGDRLYMVGTGTDRLYEINPATGAAAVVGSAVMFDAPGGGENSPSGLASPRRRPVHDRHHRGLALHARHRHRRGHTRRHTHRRQHHRKQSPRHRQQNRSVHHRPVHRSHRLHRQPLFRRPRIHSQRSSQRPPSRRWRRRRQPHRRHHHHHNDNSDQSGSVVR